MRFFLDDMKEEIRGEMMQAGKSREILGVTIDSRNVHQGDLFFAIKGARFDGHDFCHEAVKQGAIAVVVSKQMTFPSEISVMKVEDTVTALGDLASWWRKRFLCPVVAITGSNGKTTTKEMIALILESNGKTLKNEGNFNNLIGLPLTLLQLTEDHLNVVVEIGMSVPHELHRLATIAHPTIGLITNIGPAHLSGLETLDRVAHEKEKLFEALGEHGVAIMNGDDPYTQKFLARRQGHSLCFGTTPTCDVQILDIQERGPEGLDLTLHLDRRDIRFHLPLLGKHNAWNAAAAMTVGYVLGVEIETMAAILEKMTSFQMRLQPMQLASGILLLNDTYNANPSSVKAALQALKQCSSARRSIAVLGDMRELGTSSGRFHEEMGEIAAKLHIDHLFLLGDFASSVMKGAMNAGMREKQITVGKERSSFMRLLCEMIEANDVVLVKGSRGMKMEEIVQAILSQKGER